MYMHDRPRKWMSEEVHQLEMVRNKISRTIDFWFESVIEGYIVEFAIKSTVYFTIAKRKFLKVPRGIFISSFSLLIKMLLYAHDVLPLEFDTMSG